ncbi:MULTISPECIES: DUF2255 family protein [Streptosporangium]|uniref:DUF2255 domain-containing protein n=1 Tax=Streptosporangium brasiliense TaxID=47480 RepID=A0ABT9RJ87_9ACTN|nr:DUF2255 family protein [Streptosporangium brasiliense]MDP9869364.1 hypothetical protein [Streptosporangium brasiliense]
MPVVQFRPAAGRSNGDHGRRRPRKDGDHGKREAPRRSGAWCRGTRTGHGGRIWAGGLQRDVTFADADPADPAVHDQIDEVYRTKYRRYGADIIGGVVIPQARAATIKLVPER